MNGPTQTKQQTDASLKTDGGGNIAKAEANNNDRTGLFVSIASFGAALLAVGLAVGAILISENQLSYVVTDKANRERDVNSKLQVSENHWRDMEVLVKSQAAEIDRLKQERRR